VRKKSFVSRRFTAREKLAEEKKSRRLAIFLGIVTLLVIVGLIFWGIPLLIHLASFLNTIEKSEPEQSLEDTIPPVPPQFAAVPEATYTATIKIGGSSEPESKVEIYLNDKLLLVTEANGEGKFEVEKIPLQEGENLLSALAIDAAGNKSTSSEKVKVVFDNKPPELEIIEPENEAVVYEQKVEIKGKVESEDIRVTVNDHLVVIEKEGSFAYPFELQEGKNEVTIIAEDLAGNKTEKKLEITYRP